LKFLHWGEKDVNKFIEVRSQNKWTTGLECYSKVCVLTIPAEAHVRSRNFTRPCQPLVGVFPQRAGSQKVGTIVTWLCGL
jgi:hypothetical protein